MVKNDNNFMQAFLDPNFITSIYSNISNIVFFGKCKILLNKIKRKGHANDIMKNRRLEYLLPTREMGVMEQLTLNCVVINYFVTKAKLKINS